ncbi:HK97 gp10 family phage protein [Intestinimonas butyriciproducens]|uniref:HK97 gp10 family phage protein n=1 Tax=Intestinimonas butyriciproducens TaxID=1297617 RepID=UPI00189CE71D|nr:HK97 gp10 family phage protein [Intestinimonas butyriciproducens]
MKGKFIELDLSDYHRFFDRLGKAAKGDFKKEINAFLEGLGMEFLRVLQDEIERRKVMDARLLLASFQKGGDDNVWVLNDGDLSLEVGTNVKYAKWVNDGHFQEPGRFIPGYWKGSGPEARFIYSPGSDTGMVLKASRVKGKKYWEGGLRIIEKIYPEALDAKLQQWLDRYFSDFQ